MPANNKKTLPSTTQNSSGDRNISIGGNVVDSVVIAGDNNTVNQTIIQKFFNIFRNDAETTEQRNRRIMLGHVENFWVNGILEKSLYGAALLDLGIKEYPDALSYPWAIKREANKETLPAGTSMLEIFQEIGMGRSLLILGAPGAGKTTMLLELTRQLIERAREDVTEPIPVVLNLSSWTEDLTLTDWLTRELNAIYMVPKRLSARWLKENKTLLLLDGLDEVQLGNRGNCVEAINVFRRENGLTNIVICSRRQDYDELEKQLLFDGAIEIQPLTSNHIDEYFRCLGEGAVGVREIIEKDTALQEMVKTPLFLNIIVLAYSNVPSADISYSQSIILERKRLFDAYIQRMFNRSERSRSAIFDFQDSMRWLNWLARKMIQQNQSTFMLEHMGPTWLNDIKRGRFLKSFFGLVIGLIVGVILGLGTGFIFWLARSPMDGLFAGLLFGISGTLVVGGSNIEFTKAIAFWSWKQSLTKIVFWLVGGLIGGLVGGLVDGLIGGLIGGLVGGLTGGLLGGFQFQFLDEMINAGQRISFSLANTLIIFIMVGVIGGVFGTLISGSILGGFLMGLILAMWIALDFGGSAVIQNYFLLLILSQNNSLPIRLVPFLNYCVDLIFLRRVGSGYIFVHPLLMEHFAAMYPEQK